MFYHLRFNWAASPFKKVVLGSTAKEIPGSHNRCATAMLLRGGGVGGMSGNFCGFAAVFSQMRKPRHGEAEPLRTQPDSAVLAQWVRGDMKASTAVSARRARRLLVAWRKAKASSSSWMECFLQIMYINFIIFVILRNCLGPKMCCEKLGSGKEERWDDEIPPSSLLCNQITLWN